MVAVTMGADFAAHLAVLGLVGVVLADGELSIGRLSTGDGGVLGATEQSVDGRREGEHEQQERAERPRDRLQPCRCPSHDAAIA